MAKKPLNNANDPAALAFSAVEDALKDSVFNLDEPNERPQPQSTQRSERVRAADKLAAQAGTVANDDRLQSSKILYGLQSKPSSRPTMIALVASVVWVIGTLLAAVLRYGNEIGGGHLGGFLASLDFFSLLAILVIPVFGFFAIATLIRRAQDLRLAATSITHAALRLAEPETTAAEKVASVGQAVRREVNALGDGLERALSRAGELEVMIHNEVTALERTYSENESRMRALIQELASQRESVITNTERVREAITESHTGLVFDLDMISQRIAGTIVESGGNLTKALEQAGNTLHGGFGEKTESFVSLIDGRTSDLIAALDESTSRLNLTLEDRSSTISNAFEDRTQELSSVIDGRMNSLTEAIDTRAVSLSDAIEKRTAALASVLSDGGANLLNSLRDRGHEVSGALDTIGSRMANDISGRAKDAEVLIGALSRQLDESVSIQINSMESRMQSAMLEVGGSFEETAERARQILSGAGTQTLSQFDTRMDEIASLIDSRLHALDGVVGDKGERLVAALDKHNASFAARANVLEMALDEKSGHFNDVVSQRTRELNETLAARTKQITDTIGNRSREISDSLEGHAQILSEALDGRTQLLGDTIESRTQELSNALDGRTQLLHETLGRRSQELASALDTRTTRLNDTLDQRAQELSIALDSRTEVLHNAIGQRTMELNSALDTRTELFSETLEQRVQELGSALDTRTDKLQHVIDQRAAELSIALDSRTDKFGETLAQRADELGSALDSRTETMQNAITQRVSEINIALDSRTEKFSQTLQQRAGELSTALEVRTERLGDTVDKRTQEMSISLDGRIDTLNEAIGKRAQELGAVLDGRTQQLAGAIGTRSSELSEALGIRTQQLAETLGSHTNAIAAAIGDRTADLARTIEEQGIAASGKIDVSVQNVTDAMDRGADTFSTLIAGKVAEINDNLGRGVESAIVRMASAESGVTSRIDGAAATVDDSARKAASIIETGINSARKTIIDTVDDRLGSLPEAITARADLTADRLASLNSAINSALVQSMAELEAGAERLEETISTRIVAATANISSEVTETANRMDVAVRHALDQFQVTANTLDDLISIKAINTAENIGERVTQLNAAVTDQTNAFAALVSEKSDQLHLALQGHGNVLREALGENAKEAEAIMSVSTSRILTDVTAALGKLNDSNILLQKVLDASTTNLANLETSVADQTAAYSATVREAIGSTEEAGKLVTEHVGALQTTIRTLVSEFGSMIGTLSVEARTLDQASEHLSTASTTSLAALEERRGAMDALALSFTARADDIDSRMQFFAQSIAETVNDTERRLIETRRAMEEALASTSGSVTDALEATTEKVTGAIAASTSAATDAMTNTSEAVSDAIANNSDKVSNAMTSSTDRMTEVLAKNSDTVADAIAQVTAKATQALNSTTGDLSNAVAKSAGSLTEALAATNEQVASRLGDMRLTADSEGQRATEMLRQTQQALVAEMHRALEDATKRFTDTAQAMRATAKEVGAELEATRSELARGVMELPEETRASAAAMRRVVAEQIEALSELNAIVRSQPATHDLNERRPQQRAVPPLPLVRDEPIVRQEPRPELRQEARPEPHPEPVAAPEAVRQEAPVREPARPELRRQEPLIRPEVRQPEPARAERSTRLPEPRNAPLGPKTEAETVTSVARPTLDQRASAIKPALPPEPAPQAPAERSDENGGWLRDVLRNASAKQAGAAQQQNHLSGLTEEIAKSMDQGALADAWMRYQGGESNVFSRRIYTLTGQGTYDEVRKRLQRDADFERTSQAFMSEFEQLLKRAAAGPRAAAETREHLLSDRGKVYTMLAHASGRLS
ncbi:MAG: Kinesin-like protein [Hyphomicrobiales bacterium]|nr:Kinesin-like protein [Hyphomicrobiales bacterium]